MMPQIEIEWLVNEKQEKCGLRYRTVIEQLEGGNLVTKWKVAPDKFIEGLWKTVRVPVMEGDEVAMYEQYSVLDDITKAET